MLILTILFNYVLNNNFLANVLFHTLHLTQPILFQFRLVFRASIEPLTFIIQPDGLDKVAYLTPDN
jgi:hypothetical protein